MSDPGDTAAAFEALRPRLMGIAYRMLDTRADAEDAVHEAWLRLQDAGPVRSPEGFLVTTVTRLCIDELRSARRRRTDYVGPWLPEPLVTGTGTEADLERSEALSMALLRVLDRLTPLERAVFLLREVFGYDYDAVADITGRRRDHCRQLAAAARKKVRSGRPGAEASAAEHGRLVRAFLEASRSGDPEALERLLRDDVVLVSDSGGKATAARRPVTGPDAVARFMVGVVRKAPPGAEVRFVDLNGRPGAVVDVDGRPVVSVSLDVADGRIAAVLMVRNPDKLAGLVRAEGSSVGSPTRRRSAGSA